MGKNAIVTFNGNSWELASNELAKSITNIVGATTNASNSTWVIAGEYAKILDSNLFEEDFEDAKDFATFMGVSQATITQYKKAVDFVVNDATPFGAGDISVGKAYILSTVGEELNTFLDWLHSKEIDVAYCSDKALKNQLKEWKKELEAVEETGEEAVEEAGEEAVEEAGENYKNEVMELIQYLTREELEDVRAMIDTMLQ